MTIPVNEPLIQCIRQAIQTANGAISFAQFMQLALYTPGLGYYTSGNPFGRSGDFVTAPEMSPLFAECIAKQVQQILMALNRGDMLEFGAGSGVFAKDLLTALAALDCLPDNYFIVEISAALRAQQQTLFAAACPQFLSRIHWLDTPPTAFNGIIFANEVLDAMPVHCFQIADNTIYERCVSWEKEKFIWHHQSPTTPELTQRMTALLKECDLPNGYQSELSLLQPAWLQTLAACLHQGVILLIDYGYGRREYYRPERSQGTLMCFHQHHHQPDPLILVGEQDITAHVDFTLLAETAVDAGLQVAGYTTQAAFLLACGLLEAPAPASAALHYQQNQAIKRLTMPAQMGEIIKVMGLRKNLDLPLVGFTLHDRRHDL